MKRVMIYAMMAAGFAVLSFSSAAALLNVNPSVPKIVFQGTSGTGIAYTPSNQVFSVTATPVSVSFANTEGARPISGTRVFQIRFLVDSAGHFAGGVSGDDFVLSGTVTRVAGMVTNTYTGVLLTGEVREFGWLEAGSVDAYDLRVVPTGGALLSYFAAGDVAVQLYSDASTFTGSFSANFNGRPRGTLGLEDLVPPVITCPPDMQVESQAFADGLPGAYVSFPMPAVSDNCDTNPTVTCTPPSGSFFALPPGVAATNYSVLCVAKDAAGNTQSCSFLITVQDTLPPEFADPGNPIIVSDLGHPIILTNDPGKCSASYAFSRPVAVDNSLLGTFDTSVSAIDENGATLPLTVLTNGMLQGAFPVDAAGWSIITVTADDGRGNTAQHQAAVRVVDAEAPTIACPTNQTVEWTGGPVFYEEPVVSDNCPNAVLSLVPPNGSVLPLGLYLINAVVADGSGNSNQCSFSVKVQDTVAPTVTGPTNVTIELGQSTNPTNTGLASVVDNCDPAPAVSYTDTVSGSCPEVITRTWKGIDASGNFNTVTQKITVQDTTPPVLVCPADVTVYASLCSGGSVPSTDPAIALFLAGVTATDNSGKSVVVTNNAPGQFGFGTNRVTFTGTDGCGNSASCQARVIVTTRPANCDPILITPDACRGIFARRTSPQVFWTSQSIWFRGNATLTGGDQSEDFRAGTSALGTLRVTAGQTNPVVVYCNDHIQFSVVDTDWCSDTEKWVYRAGCLEEVTFRFKDDQHYNALRDPRLPVSAATGYRNVGKLETVFINNDETRFRYAFRDATRPVTITVDGIVLLSVSNNVVRSAFPYWVCGKTVEVLFPDRLVPGNVIGWYATANPKAVSAGNLIYSHTAAANGNSTDTFFNEGGRFLIELPLAGLNLNCGDRQMTVEFTLGQPGKTKVGCASFTVPTFRTVGCHWKCGHCSDDDDEDDQEWDGWDSDWCDTGW